MKFFFTFSQMSFQKYTWIKGRQLPKRALQWNCTFWRTKISIFCSCWQLPLSLVYIVINLEPDVFICQGQLQPLKAPQTRRKGSRVCWNLGIQSSNLCWISSSLVLLYPKTPPVLWQPHTWEPGYFNLFFSLSRSDRPFKGRAFNYNIYRIFMIIFILQ